MSHRTDRNLRVTPTNPMREQRSPPPNQRRQKAMAVLLRKLMEIRFSWTSQNSTLRQLRRSITTLLYSSLDNAKGTKKLNCKLYLRTRTLKSFFGSQIHWFQRRSTKNILRKNVKYYLTNGHDCYDLSSQRIAARDDRKTSMSQGA